MTVNLVKCALLKKAAFTAYFLMNLITLLKINYLCAMFQVLILCFSNMNHFLPILRLEP